MTTRKFNLPMEQKSTESADVKLIVFLHIPKAAGTTFTDFLTANFAAEECLIAHPRIPTEGTVQLADYSDYIGGLKHLPLSQTSKIRLLCGHVPFGVHRLLQRDATYVTMLRDPVSRIVSLYDFVKQSPQHYLYGEIVGKGISLEEFVASELTPEIDNGMTRLICGDARSDSLRGSEPVSDDSLERAWEHIVTQFEFIGPVEQFDRSCHLLSRKLGWPIRPCTVRNMTRGRDSRRPLSSSVRQLIEKRNSLDVELYRRMMFRFERDCLIHDVGTDVSSVVTMHDCSSRPTSVFRRLWARLGRRTQQ